MGPRRHPRSSPSWSATRSSTSTRRPPGSTCGSGRRRCRRPCLLRAYAEDHTVVGELSFTPRYGAQQPLERDRPHRAAGHLGRAGRLHRPGRAPPALTCAWTAGVARLDLLAVPLGRPGTRPRRRPSARPVVARRGQPHRRSRRVPRHQPSIRRSTHDAVHRAGHDLADPGGLRQAPAPSWRTSRAPCARRSSSGSAPPATRATSRRTAATTPPRDEQGKIEGRIRQLEDMLRARRGRRDPRRRRHRRARHEGDLQVRRR